VGKGLCLRRGAILLVLAVSLVWSASPAAAKGNIPARGYAVITGPGLSHPLVVVAPWKKSRGGYYSGEAELFLGLAGGTGALPAGRLETEAGDYVPYGVLPIDKVPSEAARGPRYRLTWFRDGVNEVARQNIYPYASAGPLVYTFHSSRRALIVLFGRFQAPAHLWTGWGRATSFDLLRALRAYGLPTVAPTAPAGQSEASPGNVPAQAPSAVPTAAAVVPAPSSGHILPVSLFAVILLALLAMSVLWIGRRSRERDPVSGV
jgi:hypothetical protein